MGRQKQQPTYSSGMKADGKKKKKGKKSARCPFCRYVHPLESVKAKGDLGQYQDALLVVADTAESGRRYFRLPTRAEMAATIDIHIDKVNDCPYSAVPDEVIPPGNVHTVMASGYGYRTFGDLMCTRQTRAFVEGTVAIAATYDDLREAGLSSDYAAALTSYAAATLVRWLKYATRGARLRQHGAADGERNNNMQVDHVFTNEASVNFQFDFL